MAEPADPVVKALENAVAAVEKARVPKDLREAAFNAALSGGILTSGTKRDASSSATDGKHRTADDPRTVEKPDRINAIARKLKCDVEAVDQVYDIDDDGIHLNIARSDLDASPSTAQQEIALLVLAAQQASGDEEFTSSRVVRDAAHDLGAYEKNHSTHIGALKGAKMRLRGKRQNRELKLNQPGYEAAAAIVARLFESAK